MALDNSLDLGASFTVVRRDVPGIYVEAKIDEARDDYHTASATQSSNVFYYSYITAVVYEISQLLYSSAIPVQCNVLTLTP